MISSPTIKNLKIQYIARNLFLNEVCCYMRLENVNTELGMSLGLDVTSCYSRATQTVLGFT